MLTIDYLDIDECSENSDGCAQVCSNTVGSYTCRCNPGFTINTSNARQCTGEYVIMTTCMLYTQYSYCFTSDVNECTSDTDNCTQICQNNLGSYTCDCRNGYRLDRNGYTCNGIIIFMGLHS